MFRVRARYYVQVPTKRQPAGLGLAKVIYGTLGVLLLVATVITLLPVLIVAGLLLLLLRSTGANLTPLAEACERVAAWLRRTPMPEPAPFVMSDADHARVQAAAAEAIDDGFHAVFNPGAPVRRGPAEPTAYPHGK